MKKRLSSRYQRLEPSLLSSARHYDVTVVFEHRFVYQNNEKLHWQFEWNPLTVVSTGRDSGGAKLLAVNSWNHARDMLCEKAEPHPAHLSWRACTTFSRVSLSIRQLGGCIVKQLLFAVRREDDVSSLCWISPYKMFPLVWTKKPPDFLNARSEWGERRVVSTTWSLLERLSFTYGGWFMSLVASMAHIKAQPIRQQIPNVTLHEGMRLTTSQSTCCEHRWNTSANISTTPSIRKCIYRTIYTRKTSKIYAKTYNICGILNVSMVHHTLLSMY